MKSKKVYINTIGCQMNVYDSDRMCNLLAGLNYQSVSNMHVADLIIVNTCAIREKAVQKVYSFLGRLPDLKQRNPGLIVVVAGCVAQQQQQRLLDRFDDVDLVIGTHAIERLSGHIREISANRIRRVDTEMSTRISESADVPGNAPSAGISRFVTIMRGCDNFCTYCVVPYVRGRETSRDPDAIVAEVESAVRAGAREVTLLGQNVNSYGQKEGLCSFAELLERVNTVAGLVRVRFVTSHPKDLSDDLIRAFSRIDKLCNHIHLPVQSGSDRILKKMNRRYTRDEYLEKVDKLRRARPDIAISTDFIVGFPGETLSDFEQTIDLLKQARFDTLFAFEYSDRPEAPARRFADKIASDIKNRRLQTLLNTQQSITQEIYSQEVGKTVSVLVEGMSKKHRQHNEKNQSSPELSGRTTENRIVNFTIQDGDILQSRSLIGELVSVRIEKACLNSLKGVTNETPFSSYSDKGGNAHVA